MLRRGGLLKRWGGLEVHTQTGFEPPAGLQPGVRRRLPDYGGPDPERTLHTRVHGVTDPPTSQSRERELLRTTRGWGTPPAAVVMTERVPGNLHTGKPVALNAQVRLGTLPL